MLNVLGLFSGIGGFELGFQRAGFTIAAMCEIEPYARAVLRKHWPDVPIYGDVKELTGARLTADGIHVDVITGGFPCQDISLAGKGVGLGGERSGLWVEFHRIIDEVRPQWAVIENVSALRSRGLDQVLSALAAIGYDAEWHCIPASAVGAPHRRDRVWIVAHANGQGKHDCAVDAEVGGTSEPTFTHALREQLRQQPRWGSGESGAGAALAAVDGEDGDVADAICLRQLQPSGSESDIRRRPAHSSSEIGGQWLSEPDVGRVVTRLPARMDGGRLDGADRDGGTGEILRALRGGVSPRALQWPARGLGRFQTTQVLLADLCGYEGKTKPLGNVSLAGSKASPVVMRGVWFDGTTACPSCRRAAGEQRGVEYPDVVRLLSQLLACDCRSTWLDATGTPSESSRVARLRALGNAVVPQIPQIIAEAIKRCC